MLLNSRSGPVILALTTLGIFRIMAYFSHIMKNLIIHPEDPTTEFLSAIYVNLTNKTVVKGGITKSELRELIESHDRVLMLGHGSPYGLLSQGRFPDNSLYIIDDSMVLPLKNKSNSIFIWCHTDKFVQRHGLTGLCTGMFISEVGEAIYNGFEDIEWDMINQSNERFASIVSKYINEPIKVLYPKLVYEYELLARANPIVRFNLERLYLSYSGTNKSTNKVVTTQSRS
jgi:hypothetical protein